MDKTDDAKKRKINSVLFLVIISAILLLNSGMFTVFDKRTIKISECDATYVSIDRDNCYSRYAIEAKNPVLCENMAFEHARSLCLLDVASSIQNVTICEKIREQKWNDLCRYTITSFNIPIKEARPPCSSYKDETVRNLCEGNMSAYENK